MQLEISAAERIGKEISLIMEILQQARTSIRGQLNGDRQPHRVQVDAGAFLSANQRLAELSRDLVRLANEAAIDPNDEPLPEPGPELNNALLSRALKSLRREGIRTCKHLALMSKDEVSCLKNVGKKAANELQQFLKERGLQFQN